eukprot:tig00021612_g22896.t1
MAHSEGSAALQEVQQLEASYRETYNELQSYREMLANQAAEADSSLSASPDQSVKRPSYAQPRFSKTPPSTRGSTITHGTAHTDAVIERLLSYGEKVRKRAEELRKRKEEQAGTWKPAISEKARKLRRDGIIIEKRLIHKYQEVMSRLDKMRKKKEQDEISENRDVPQIDRRSKKIASNRHSDVAERLLEYADLHKRFVENMRSRKDEAELYEVSGKPDINPVSKQLVRNMPVEEFLFSWEEERQRRLKEAQEYSSVADRLIYQGLISKMKKEALAREKEKFDKAEACPQISVHSANLIRNGDPFERLYQQSFALRGKREMLAQLQDSEGQQDGQLFKPRISLKAAQRPSSASTVSEGLYAQGLELMRRRQRLIERQALELKMLSEKPKISFNSEILVQMLEKRLHLSHMDRLTGLYKPNRAARDFLEQQLLEREKQITFKPKINRTSRALDQQVHGEASGLHRAELLASKHERVKQKLLMLQSKKEEEQLEECTFRPSIKKTLRKLPPHYVSIVHRVSDYLERRQAKLERERQEKMLAEVEECTFRPRTMSTAVSNSRESHLFDETQAVLARKSPLIFERQQIHHATPKTRPTPLKAQDKTTHIVMDWSKPRWQQLQEGSNFDNRIGEFVSPEKPMYHYLPERLNLAQNMVPPARRQADVAADDDDLFVNL